MNQSVVDACRVALALRAERAGDNRPLLETSQQLLAWLGFGSVAEMELWSDAVHERVQEQIEETRRRRAAGENV